MGGSSHTGTKRKRPIEIAEEEAPSPMEKVTSASIEKNPSPQTTSPVHTSASEGHNLSFLANAMTHSKEIEFEEIEGDAFPANFILKPQKKKEESSVSNNLVEGSDDDMAQSPFR